MCVCVSETETFLTTKLKKKKAMLTTTEEKFGKQYIFQEDSFIHLGFFLNISMHLLGFLCLVPIENIFLYILLVLSGYKKWT